MGPVGRPVIEPGYVQTIAQQRLGIAGRIILIALGIPGIDVILTGRVIVNFDVPLVCVVLLVRGVDRCPKSARQSGYRLWIILAGNQCREDRIKIRRGNHTASKHRPRGGCQEGTGNPGRSAGSCRARVGYWYAQSAKIDEAVSGGGFSGGEDGYVA